MNLRTRRPEFSTVAGVMLILGGILFLMQTLNVIPSGMPMLWSTVFGLCGLTFLFYFVTDRRETWWAAIPGMTLLGLAGTIAVAALASENRALQALAGSLMLLSTGFSFLLIYWVHRDFWWALIPGGTLFGLGSIIVLSGLLPDAEDLIGALFLGLIGLGFWIVRWVAKDQWWAIIPAGVMTTLAVMVGMERFTGEFPVGGMMLGFAATFALVGVLPTKEGRMQWAFIPAAILAVIGVIFLASMESVFAYTNVFWSAVLILIGIYMVIRALIRHRRLE